MRIYIFNRYHFIKSEAEAFANFLIPMLNYYPYKRQSAAGSLASSWFTMPKPDDYKLSEEEVIKLMTKRQMEAELGIEKKFEQVNYFDDDLALADSEDNDTYEDDNDWEENMQEES